MSYTEYRLDNICDVITCGVAKRPDYVDSGVPFLSSLNVKENRFILKTYKFITKADHVKLTKYAKPENGDILYTRVGSFGEAAVVDLDFEFSIFVSLTLIKPKRNLVNSRYLMWYLNSPKVREFAKNNTSGIGVQNLNVSVVREYKILLPPLPVQQKIAAILDAADELLQKDKALVLKYDELTQALFLDMFGDPVSNPKGWEKAPLKQFGTITTGNTPSRAETDNYSLLGMEWIKTDNISENNLYVSKASEFLSDKGLIKARTVEKDSILVACIAGSIESIGRAALTDRKVSFNQQINAIYPNSHITSRFLYYQIRFSKKHIQNHASSGMKRMLSKGDFEKIMFVLPPLSIQKQFTERVKAIEEQKNIAQKSAMKSEELFNSLLQKAFNGELV